MKLLDEVKVIVEKQKYNQQGVFKDMIGTIWSAEIRDNCFLVLFMDEKFQDKSFEWTEDTMKKIKTDITIPIDINDLQVVKEGSSTDKDILDDIPKQNPKWWCKVEDGYIINLLGEKKNKIPYDYNS